MRNISFAMTTEQIKHRTKFVTRRTGWDRLKVGDLLCAVKKGMGLKKGEKVERLAFIRVVNVRKEPLRRMLDDPAYGYVECILEGFANDPDKGTPQGFVEFFLATHPCTIDEPLTRIEFEYMGKR
jgi:hypothetical protein